LRSASRRVHRLSEGKLDLVQWSAVNFRRIHTNGVTLNVACDGPEDGPLVILLHGFPEFWYGWRAQIPALVAAGLRVLAPDLRGYDLSDKPRGISAYRADVVAADIVGLIDDAGRDRATIVGHDWGGAVAWTIAMRHAERVSRLVVLNCGHPSAMLRRIATDPRQLARSWYIFALQFPWLPERLARANDFRMLVRALRGSSARGTFSDDDFARYREAWSQPGALSAMIDYYRAALRRRPPKSSPRVRVPTHVIWGTHDRFLGRELAEDSLEYCDHGELTYLDTTHWVQHEAAERVSDLIIDAARAPSPASPAPYTADRRAE
jgi:pimeloyl-ACP methyl ester carboxylesterase